MEIDPDDFAEAAPRRWGYTRDSPEKASKILGCPTQVGIYLSRRVYTHDHHRLPHAGGDIPIRHIFDNGTPLAAPRRWGYTYTLSINTVHDYGCPTQVGIYRTHHPVQKIANWLPHAGGDIPYTGNGLKSKNTGCPTQVGIYHTVKSG